MCPKRITMEDLHIATMTKNRLLMTMIHQQNFHEFVRQMKYKCAWNNIPFVLADQYFPSSKTCSQCGHIKKDLTLNQRLYVCDVCGLQIDRDYNAALNLMNYQI